MQMATSLSHNPTREPITAFRYLEWQLSILVRKGRTEWWSCLVTRMNGDAEVGNGGGAAAPILGMVEWRASNGDPQVRSGPGNTMLGKWT